MKFNESWKTLVEGDRYPRDFFAGDDVPEALEDKAKEAGVVDLIELEVTAKAVADAEAKKIADAEAKKVADAEAKKVADAEAKKVADAEAKKVADAEAKKVADAEAKSK
ncbi:MAG: hypothetical protein JKY94_07985 [Rhodobacteraceae bacterium]|nr:hypothetical protein [Paracoccaceae bacterium]